MNNQTLLLIMAVTVSGIFILPNSMALFSGQHTFDKAGNSTICAKCHSDVVTEIQSGYYHKSLIAGSPNDCMACHTASKISSTLIPLGNKSGNQTVDVSVGLDIANGRFTMANGTNITGLNLHSAVTVECVSCHYAVNFTDDAHKPFANNASSQGWLKGANAACVGCHTKTRVEMTWTRKGGYNYSFDFLNNTGTLSFNDTNVTASTNNTGS
jgi:hypothetical protein